MALNLKEEATKLETRLEKGCFQHKNTEECHLLGQFWELIQQNNSRAATVYQSNCQGGQHAGSCYRLGQLCHTDVRLQDHRAAFEWHRRGCQLGSAQCCLDAGMSLLGDNLHEGCVGQDFPLAVDYLKRACQLGSGMACYLLAGVYISGIPAVVDRDVRLAFKYDFEACTQLDFPLACANLDGALATATPAPSIGGQVATMAWDPTNKEERKTLLKQLGSEYREKCLRQKSPRDCHHLALFLATVEQDISKAATVWKRTCDDHRYGDSCQKFASLVRRGIAGVDPIVSVDYDRQACRYGQAKSCFHAALAIIARVDSGRGVRINQVEADDPSEAVHLLQRGCHLGCDSSCYLAGGLYLAGVPHVLQRDVSLTYRYDLKACQLGNQLACANLTGALAVECSNPDNSTSNGFLIRRLQLKIRDQQLRKDSSNAFSRIQFSK